MKSTNDRISEVEFILVGLKKKELFHKESLSQYNSELKSCIETLEKIRSNTMKLQSDAISLFIQDLTQPDSVYKRSEMNNLASLSSTVVDIYDKWHNLEAVQDQIRDTILRKETLAAMREEHSLRLFQLTQSAEQSNFQQTYADSAMTTGSSSVSGNDRVAIAIAVNQQRANLGAIISSELQTEELLTTLSAELASALPGVRELVLEHCTKVFREHVLSAEIEEEKLGTHSILTSIY